MKAFIFLGWIALLFASSAAFGAGRLGADIELICPCTYSATSSSSVIAKLGVVNRAQTATGALWLRAYAHTNPDYFSSPEADRQHLGDFQLTRNIAPGGQLDTSEFQFKLKQPIAGRYYVTLLLLDKNYYIADLTRSSGQVEFVPVPTTNYGEFYLPEDPVYLQGDAGGTLETFRLSNGGSTTENVNVSLWVSESADLFAGASERLADVVSDQQIAAGTTATLDGMSLLSSQLAGAYPYLQLVVSAGSYTQLVHTLDGPVVPSPQFFVANSLDLLTDLDEDGVADHNEILAGTDPESVDSRPEASTLDLLVLYGPRFKALYGDEPSARIDHLIAVANQALADSEVEIKLRIADSVLLEMNTREPIDAWLKSAEKGEGVYTDLEERRLASGADLVVMLRRWDGGQVCGLATLGGYATQGVMTRTSFISASFDEFGVCGDTTVVHEIGHNLGLGHSYRQDETGTFAWSRGHGVTGSFATLMAYGREFGVGSELPLFSNPNVEVCDGQFCGVAADQKNGADAAASLNAVRFQVADYTPEKDSDNDGVSDYEDAFPNDGNETVDTDGDGIGNNSDDDDDGDQMPDSYELANGLNPLLDDSFSDLDSDGLSNIEEFLSGTEPDEHVCLSETPVYPSAADSELEYSTYVPMVNPASNLSKISKIRFANTTDLANKVEIYGIDDTGNLSLTGPVVMTLGSFEAKVITAQDLEFGNPIAGLSGYLCDGTGKWQLLIRSSDPVGITSYLATADGFIAGINKTAPAEFGLVTLYLVNPGRNVNKVSLIRLINRSDQAGSVTINAYDDAGQPGREPVVIELAANAVAQFTSADLEQGNDALGLTGSIGTGEGKWRLEITSDLDIDAMSLIRTSDGFMTNLSEVVPLNEQGEPVVYFANSSQSVDQVSLLRFSNTSDLVKTVSLSGRDDAGNIAPGGDLMFTVAPKSTVELVSEDIEFGNQEKGALGGLGEGDGRWRLVADAGDGLEVMSLIRTSDGFLTNVSSVASAIGMEHQLPLVNPGSETNPKSLVRFINNGDSVASLVVSAIDDLGHEAPGGIVTLDLSPYQVLELSSAELEDGAQDKGVSGSLGDGAGHWRLFINTAESVVVQHLLQMPSGYVTNLSRGIE